MATCVLRRVEEGGEASCCWQYVQNLSLSLEKGAPELEVEREGPGPRTERRKVALLRNNFGRERATNASVVVATVAAAVTMQYCVLFTTMAAEAHKRPRRVEENGGQPKRMRACGSSERKWESFITK